MKYSDAPFSNRNCVIRLRTKLGSTIRHYLQEKSIGKLWSIAPKIYVYISLIIH